MADQTVAILGASTNRAKYGNIAVRAYIDQGWTVYPVNPRADEIEGLKCYATLGDVPGHLDRVSVYLPPAILLDALDDIAAKAPDEVWLNPGTESDAVLEKAKGLGLNVIQACSIIDVGVAPGEYR
ncbi:MAG: CoA-binding protein [Phycisphaerales bacterium]|nr:CoA-binding protein [Phycisphaerales bacterium]